jgi:hypothetical protein
MLAGPAGRADGQLRGRPHEPRRRPRGVPGLHPGDQGDPRRRVLRNAAITAAVDKAVGAGKAVHILGLLSPMAACTATRTTWSPWPSWPPSAAPRTSTCTRSSTVATPRRKAPTVHRAARRHLRQAGQGPHRQPQRPLLRHGPRQSLGPCRAGLQPDRRLARAQIPRRQRARRPASRLCPRKKATSSSKPPPSAAARRRRWRRRGVHELPRRPRPRADPRLCRGRIFPSFRASASRNWPASSCLTQYAAEHARAQRLRAAELSLTTCSANTWPKQRQDPAAHRRNREIRPRHLLLLRRPRRAVRRARSASWCPVAERRHLRPAAGDELPGSHRPHGRGHRAAAL